MRKAQAAAAVTMTCACHCRYQRGYKNVINKGIELNKNNTECELMMETSGHGALRENRFLDDGAYMSVKLIIEDARRRWEGRKDIRCAWKAPWSIVCIACSESPFVLVFNHLFPLYTIPILSGCRSLFLLHPSF